MKASRIHMAVAVSLSCVLVSPVLGADRFTDNKDGTVTDNQTTLMWLKNAGSIESMYPAFDNDRKPGDGRVTYEHAIQFVAGMNDGTYKPCSASYGDWRLPKLTELQSLPRETGENIFILLATFQNMGVEYWSFQETGETAGVWLIHGIGGLGFNVIATRKTDVSGVWAVRDARNTTDVRTVEQVQVISTDAGLGILKVRVTSGKNSESVMTFRVDRETEILKEAPMALMSDGTFSKGSKTPAKLADIRPRSESNLGYVTVKYVQIEQGYLAKEVVILGTVIAIR